MEFILEEFLVLFIKPRLQRTAPLRFRDGKPITLRILPAEVRFHIFEYCLPWNGKSPNLLKALRSDPELHAEAMKFMELRRAFILRKENDWSLQSMPRKLTLNILKLEVHWPTVNVAGSRKLATDQSRKLLEVIKSLENVQTVVIRFESQLTPPFHYAVRTFLAKFEHLQNCRIEVVFPINPIDVDMGALVSRHKLHEEKIVNQVKGMENKTSQLMTRTVGCFFMTRYPWTSRTIEVIKMAWVWKFTSSPGSSGISDLSQDQITWSEVRDDMTRQRKKRAGVQMLLLGDLFTILNRSEDEIYELKCRLSYPSDGDCLAFGGHLSYQSFSPRTYRLFSPLPDTVEHEIKDGWTIVEFELVM
ncbi:hypothetical protein PVAG01_00891 [Phlyctema vagabunda]|uniref:Uncharacterized protein n=1 Tax=Phlyctema vagabunda TaxID=108571 RepID=A0ABR4PVK7_9HELO